MDIAVDIRGLNYPKRTGINTYTLHFLYQLYLVKADTKCTITGIGLRHDMQSQLENKYPFMKSVFDAHRTYGEYIGVKSFGNTRLLNILVFLVNRFLGKMRLGRCTEYDILFLPQPKPTLAHPYTDILPFFHDMYPIISHSSRSWKERILENKHVYRLLAVQSMKIWVNSVCTGIDCETYLGIEKDRIALVYPALPIWHELEHKPLIPRVKTTPSKEFGLPKKFLLCISGIEERKNWDCAILAFHRFSQAYPSSQLQLVLAGQVIDNTYYKSLLKLIQTHNIQNVRFLLDISEQRKSELLSSCYAVLYPSLYEGFGFVILEAFNAGKPVITSRVSSMMEIGRDGCVYVNPYNISDIARAIDILEHDVKFYDSLTNWISQKQDVYSWEELHRAIRKELEVEDVDSIISKT
jgi:glycosyltransferase involved in cell wall biosynthesis